MDDLLNEFLTETAESIDVVDVELVKLEQDPNNKPVLDNIFRLVHTIKGTCGFLGLPRLESVAHASENVLGKFRDGELDVTPDAVTVILESLDRIKEILGVLEATEQEPEGDDSALIARLDAIIEGGGEPAEAAEQAPDEAPAEAEGELKPGEVSLDELEAAFQAAPGPEGGDGAASADNDTAEEGVDLFEAIGGDDAISVIGHLICNRIAGTATLASFFENSDQDAHKAKMNGLLAALVKDQEAEARTLAAALPTDGGFGESQFAEFIAAVKSSCTEVGLDEELIDDFAMLFELVRGDFYSGSEAAGKKKAEAAKSADAKAGNAAPRTAQSIRVNVDLLEDLMNMVSELVLTRNQLLQMVRALDDSEFAVPLQRLSQCTTELQEGVMKTRMQPIGNAWAKLPRIVRDLTVELDKKIELEMKGEDTELDRQVLEMIKDPLTHMVRNSADHGIETPAQRLAAGKPETGTVRLNAFHEGGHIIIEISDDGRGLPVAKLKAKALEKGLASETELEEMTDNQIQRLIFHAGFSTAKEVTSVSGRGVGMDVVRSNIEKIGGAIDMQSTEGKGTTFRIKIPLTLAIVSALIVQARTERFAIPQINVLELVRASKESEHKIERIKDTPVLRLRNRLLPLVYLNEVLEFERHDDEEDRSEEFIVVTQVGAFIFGIVVDQVFDTEEIVVKPVAPILKDISVYSGNTILGDGSVIMILDPNGIASIASSGLSEGDEDGEEDATATVASSDKESLLVFRAGSETQKAVPLSLVARLEEFEVEKVESSDGRLMVQYRGALMPLVTLIGQDTLKTEGRQPVLVFADGEKSMGLVVDEILDIVEDTINIELASETAGLVGSAVVQGKASEIIDVAFYATQAFADWHKSAAGEAGGAGAAKALLLVDDSSFFRNMLKPLLSAAGYAVTAVESAEKALELQEGGQKFDLIVTDIEMPGMNGFEFAEEIKKGTSWTQTPIVALSSFTGSTYFERGREIGFNDYVAKFDRDALLQSLSEQLKIEGEAA